VLSALEQLLLPAECLVCRALLPFARAHTLICPVCRLRFRPVVPPWCERCGQPGPHFGPCRLCARWPGALRTARSAVWLGDAARAAVHALKYRGFSRLAEDLADVMVRLLPAPDAGTVLVPVPLGPRRRRTRGYNQSECVARALGRRWDRPVAPDLVVRRRETASQTALTPEAREANVAGAFGVTQGSSGGLTAERGSEVQAPGLTYMLVDDVLTTGVSLAAAARALERTGTVAVSAVTFGRAVITDFT
jgi:predicted amidophosphoribosyltransferase